VVLRQPRTPEWDDLDHHAAVLAAVHSAGVLAPRPLAVDATGEAAGRPSLVMERMPGEANLPAVASDTWLRSLAGGAADIHRTSVAGLDWLPDRVARVQTALGQPIPDEFTVEADRELWSHLAALPQERYRGAADGLVHMDFWSGNTLRDGDVVVGVVDWAQACRGPAEVDVAECALDLWLSRGQEVAARFIDTCRDTSGCGLEALDTWLAVSLLRSYDYERWLPGWLDLGLDVTLEQVRERRESVRTAVEAGFRG
jgi:aminoglycoside phosphotransferase (APT) family kinase protein